MTLALMFAPHNTRPEEEKGPIADSTSEESGQRADRQPAIRASVEAIKYFLALAALLCSTGWLCAAPGDQHWDSQFGPVGANAQVETMTLCGNTVYVGGFINSAGNTAANCVAGFDGTNWFPLNNGVAGGGPIIGLGSDGTNVYASGLFTNADNSGAINNAVWDGTNWSPLAGNTLDGVAYVFKWYESNLYVGGILATAGVYAVNGIARWDGRNWWPLGTGVSGCTGALCNSGVTCLAFQGSNVYVGGTFLTAGAVSAGYVAQYDGTAWHALGNAINGPLTALQFYGGYLYAGGFFTNSSAGLTNIARWDGSAWSGVNGGANLQVRDFATDGTNLYAGGLFTEIGGIAANGVASWNGSVWTPLGSGITGFEGNPGAVYHMAWQSNQLYVAGPFTGAGNVGASQVARWDGSNWWSLGGQTSKGLTWDLGFAQSLLGDGTNLYAGGFFTDAGNVLANGIASWDGTNWSALGSGLTGTFSSPLAQGAKALAILGGNLYAGGNFTTAGGMSAPGIAYWDGSNWNPVSGGVDWVVQALAPAYGNSLYVGGSFTNADGLPSQGIALVDQSGNWYGTGGVSGGNGSVLALAEDDVNGILYAAGNFRSAGGVGATNLAAWNGSSWSPLGSGMNNSVAALALATNGILYAGGPFTSANGVAVNHIASWNGTNWSPLGSGLAGSGATVAAILINGTNVYVTGVFTNAGGVLASNIAYWDGTQWWAMGSGLSGSPGPQGYALGANGNDLYVGGTAAFAGGKPSEYIAHWNDQLNFYPPPKPQLTRMAWHTNRQFSFRLIGTSGQQYVIQSSTNLQVWTPLFTNSATLYDFTDSAAASFGKRFYRAVVTP